MLPKAVRNLTQELTSLPGIGPKTAQRLAIHLLRQPRSTVSHFADTLKNLHANVRICDTCYNLAEDNICNVCKNEMRNRKLLCVVEDALDVEAIESTNAYNGLYHVLGGVLSPVGGIDPEHLTLNQLYGRLVKENIAEIIIALDHKLESDATTRHIISHIDSQKIKVTRLARGLPTGGDIEFADVLTLSAAINSRSTI